jgi:hypothetical protein
VDRDFVEFAASSRRGSCALQRPGHTVNVVQARRSRTETAVAVQPRVEPEWGTVHFVAEGEPKLMWNHDAQRLAAALAGSEGTAFWLAANRCLAVPRDDDPEFGLARYALFSLTPLEKVGLCRCGVGA